MENMEELLKKYARARTTPEETVEVRRYLSEHFDKMLQVIDEMRLDAKHDLDLSDDADDPVDELKALLAKKSSTSTQMCCSLDGLPHGVLPFGTESRPDVQQVLFDLLLGEDKEK